MEKLKFDLLVADGFASQDFASQVLDSQDFASSFSQASVEEHCPQAGLVVLAGFSWAKTKHAGMIARANKGLQ